MSNKQVPENIIHNLLDLENLTILMGTGIAKACGGQTMDDISKLLVLKLDEKELDTDINRWSNSYLKQERTNFESFFNSLLVKRKYLDSIGTTDKLLDEVLYLGKEVIFNACSYIPSNDQIKPLIKFIKCLTERKSGLARVNLFSLNYDLLIENVCDRLGVLINDGFEGALQRKFNSSIFDLDFYYPSGVVGTRPTRCEKVLNFIKLHGSINWAIVNNSIIKTQPDPNNMFIYPSQDKLEDTLLNPFSEVFRRFSLSNKRYKNGILVIGYGFFDSHVNNLLLQALEQPHTFMIIVNPDQEVWKINFSAMEIHLNKVISIPDKFENFCEKYLPQNLHIMDQNSLENIAQALIDAMKNNISSDDKSKEF